MGFKSSLSSIKQISFFSFVLGILTPGYLFGQSVAQEINPKLKILGTAEDYSGVRGVLLADIYGVADFDQAKTYSYQWLANGNAIAGATNQTIDVGDFKSSIENKVISVEFTYTNTSGQQKSIISAVMPYEGFRIVANAENGRNEWSGTTASEEIVGSVNPYPFVESYSNNGTSSTDGTSSGSAHNITAVKASDVGITAREGDNVIRIYADGSKSNRSELAHLNNETTFKEGEEYYFSGSFFAPKSEWDPVTEGGSTVITQLKQYGGGDPNFELRLSNNGDYKMFWRAVPHDLDAYQRMGSAIPDAWNDLKIYTKHSQGSDGVFRVWLNNEKAVDYSGATMYRSAEGYLKFGMYTEIHDERIIYWDAIDIADHLENDFDTWLSSSDNLPSLTVSGISDNQQFTSADQLSISGSAIDPAGNQLGSSGRIKSVDLFLDNTKIQSSTDSNFSFSNLNLSNGEHKLRLVATDTDGNTAEKNYTIWIGNKPADISIEASDFLLGSFNTDSDVALTTTATDSDGTITSVEFLANGQLIGAANKDNDHQYSLNWRPSQAGAYSIQARATDNQGAVTLSDSKAALVGTSITGSTLTATQDVTITQNSSSTGNYSNTEVYGSTSAPKIALVEFDLSDISSAKYIQSAVFKPYVTKLQNSPGTFSIYAAGTVDWNQTSADWYDKPSKGKLLDTITISSTNQYVSFDVTEALQDAIDAGQAKITLWIEDSEQEQQRFDFASENNSSISKPAELIVSSAKEALPVPVAGSFKLDGDSGDSTAPSFISAATSADGTKVILTYNEALSSTTAATSDFIITVDGSAATLSSVATSGSTVELTLSSAVVYGQTITVAYTDPTSGNDSNTIQDGAGNDAGDLSTTTVSNQVAEAGQGILQILGSTVNDKDWDQHIGGKHLRADLSQLNNRDTTKAITYQWYADGEAVSGATSRDFKLEDHSISNEAIHLVATYTTLSGQQRIATSPTLNQLDWRIFSGGEYSSIAGDYPYTGIMESNLVGDNPTPFMATYSFASSSRTHGGNGWYEDGYRASETHSITSINASDQGLPTQEGTNILKIAATSDSKRVEWGNRNFNTRVQENQDVYVSQKVYLPSSEWDSVTRYSTLIFQHKQYPGSDPNFEIRLSNLGDYKLYVRSPYSHYGLTGQRVTDYPVATLNPDTWHDLKIHLTPSKSNNVGQMTIYLDGEVIFSEQGTNLNDIDSTNDSFLKLGMYTQILDDRHYFVDSVEMTTFLPSTVSDWVTGATTVVTSPTRLLTILNLENGSVTGGGTFSLGLDATLTATPSAGYIFASWSGDASSTDNPLTVTMDDSKSIGATFTEDTRDPDGDGLSNYQELVVLGTDPIDEDSDADGYNDGDEVTDGTDPNDSDSYPDPDKTAPTFSSAATSTDGTKVILTYNEALSSTTAATSDFIITVDGSAATLSSVATSGSTVELTLSSAVKNGQTVTVTYNDPTTNNDNNAVQDSAGNDALSLTSNAVNNDSTVVDNQTTKLFVTQDVSIIENSSTNGDWSKNEVYGGSTPVIALVEFDLSSFSKGNTIQSATFRPYVRTLKNNQNSSFSIFSTTAKDWSQSSVQWRTRPLKDKRLDTITIAKSGSYVDFDVTNAIQAAIDNGQSKVTLWIEDSEKEYEGFEFDSVNDNPKYPNKPELVILTGRLVEPSNIPALVSINSSQYLIGSYKIGESITLKAAASDSDGSISKLEFLADGNLLGTATENSSGQYSFTWDASIGGAYSIQAKATDNQGAITLSDSKAVIITNDAFGNITITASQDVSIKDGMTGNWGDNEVYGHATNPFITLVEFNLDSIDNIDNLISATFEPYVVYLKNGAGDFSAYSTEYKSWNEKTVNWITKPDKGDLLDKITITELNKRASFEVTTAIENVVVSGHRSITLWIEDSEKEWEKFEFDSTRSDQPNPPQLILEFISMDIPDPIKGSTILPDNAAPSIQLVTDKTFLKAHETANITFTLSEPSSDFNEADINVYGGTLSNFSGSGKLYKVVFVPAVDSAINGKLSIKDGSFSNEAGIFNENQSDSDNLIIFHIDTSHPTMTLKGESKVTLEAGSEYSDQGAAATDVGDGDLSEAIKVSGEVDSNKPGTYELKYDVKDSAGNEAVTITRTVVVVDTASPVITLIGEATVRVEVGGAYEELGVTAKDSVDGNLTSKVKVTGKVDVKKVGEYQLKYTVSDAAGNAAVEKIRTVLVGDTERPIISLKGNPEITIEAGDVYNDAGAVATDVGDGDLSEAIKVSGEVDSNKPGTYELKYDVKDSAGNEAVTFTRTVIVVDTTPPVITLVGESIVTVEVGSDYEDQGTVANDSVDGDLTSKVKVTGKVDVQKVGKYQLKYNVEDASGNAAKELVRNVLVGDTGRPIISLRGDSNTTIEAGSIYEDAGAQAIDTGDGDLSSKIEVVSTVNTDKIGEYTVTYTVSDSSGNEAVEVKRVVKVVDTTAPVITMLGSAAKTVEAKSVYIDEGATAVDTLDEALVVTSVSTVNTDVVGSYTVIYNVSDASGNAAVPVIRKVIVVDTTSPVITLVGEAIVRVEVGNDYKDQGATAKDSVDGDLTSQIKVTGKVDVKKAGEYQLKYNVYDAAGNKSVELTRMVIVETAIIKTIHIEKYNSVPFWFKFKSKKEKSYAIESSTDLREWKQINVIKGTGAIVRFEDDRDQVFLQIFFRVRMID